MFEKVIGPCAQVQLGRTPLPVSFLVIARDYEFIQLCLDYPPCTRMDVALENTRSGRNTNGMNSTSLQCVQQCTTV